MQPLRIFIGFDEKETVAYHVACQSIIERASVPVSITPLVYDTLPMDRDFDPLASTAFTYTRFLVPYLCNYEGYALFMDCDVIVNCDVAELFDMVHPDDDVSVCKHPEYTSKQEVKFLGNQQTNYPMKNWSSVMLFNCARCQDLTPEVVNRESGKYLHRFEWAQWIGELPLEYNHLVGEYEDREAKIYHYTLGTPCFSQTARCDKSGIWHKTKRNMLHCADL